MTVQLIIVVVVAVLHAMRDRDNDHFLTTLEKQEASQRPKNAECLKTMTISVAVAVLPHYPHH